MTSLTVISPLALVALLGFLLARLRAFSQTQINAVSALTFSLLIPVFLFKSTSQADLSAGLSRHWFITMYSAILVTFFVLFLTKRFVIKSSSASASLSALAGTYSNTVLVSIPILIGLIGEQRASQGFILIAFHSAMLFLITELFVTSLSIRNVLDSLKNPLVLSIASGLMINLADINLPSFFVEPLTMLSSAAIPLALFCLGASMNYLPIKGNRTESAILSMVKLIILPAITYVIGWYAFQLDKVTLLILVLLTASPTGVNAFLIASKHKTSEGVTATTVVVSTLLSVMTMSIWSYLILDS